MGLSLVGSIVILLSMKQCNKMRPLLRLNKVAIFSKYAVC